MSTDTVISLFLIGIVIRQIREHKLEPHVLILPVVLVGFTASHYLTNVSLGGNDPILISILVGSGLVFGAISGLATKMRLADDGVYSQAGPLAAGIWIASMTFRAVFVYATAHGFGDNVATFSMHHNITSESAWAVAFIGMAVAEVTVRMIIMFTRSHRLQSAPRRLVAA